MSPQDHPVNLKIVRVSHPGKAVFVQRVIRHCAEVLPSTGGHDPFPATSGIK